MCKLLHQVDVATSLYLYKPSQLLSFAGPHLPKWIEQKPTLFSPWPGSPEQLKGDGKARGFSFQRRQKPSPTSHPPTHPRLGPPPSGLHRLVGLLRFLKAYVPRGGIKDGGMQTRVCRAEGAVREAVWGRARPQPRQLHPSPHQRGRERKRKGQQYSRLSEEFRILAWGGVGSLEGPDYLQSMKALVSLGGCDDRGQGPGARALLLRMMEGEGYSLSNDCFLSIVKLFTCRAQL